MAAGPEIVVSWLLMISRLSARPASADRRILPATRANFRYTFDNISSVIGRFTEVIGFDRFAVYLFDYGAPLGFRLAIHHPERITAIISQNGNAYEEGLSDGWTPIRAYWEDPSQANRNELRAFLTPGNTPTAYPTKQWCRPTARISTTSI
jgi:pimeloyl-ACP methyl ester carboxylesterase